MNINEESTLPNAQSTPVTMTSIFPERQIQSEILSKQAFILKYF